MNKSIKSVPRITLCIVCDSNQYLAFSYRNFDYYRCIKCKLVSTYPLPDAASIRRHYADRYKNGNYLLLRKYAPQYLSVYSQFVKILEQKLHSENQTLKDKKVLDVGCFTGDFLKLLEQKNADVYGVELQKEAVKIANKKLPGRIYNADIATYTFPQKKYDIVTLLGLVEHIQDPVSLIKRSYQLLNKNGTIMIQTPNSSSFLAKAMGKYWPPFTPIEHIHLFSRYSLEYTLKKCGFNNLSFKAHYKKLPVGYVYNMFDNFGPEFYSLLKPLDKKISKTDAALWFYVGEMIITATKK